MNTAAVINDGSTQSIRLPEEVRLEGDEVYVKQVGRSILLIPTNVDRWQMLVDSLDEFTPDYMADRAQPPSQQREPAFE